MTNNVFLDKYNSTILELIDEIKNLELSNYKDIIINENELLNANMVDTYLNNCNILVDDFSTKNAIIFCENIEVIKGIDFYLLWNNADLSDHTRENIWKYLFTLYLYGYAYKYNLSLTDIIKKYKDNSNITNDSEKILFSIIDNLNNEKKIKKLAQKEKDSLKNANTSGFDFPLGDSIMNGEIGKLAKEIASEINPADFESELENQNPQELLSALFSGNIDKDSPILNLVKTISGKIQNKVTDGNINETALFQEAQSMLGNNSLFKDVMKNTNINVNSRKESCPDVNIETKYKNDEISKRKKILKEKLIKRKKSMFKK